jgi:hypothetical protein
MAPRPGVSHRPSDRWRVATARDSRPALVLPGWDLTLPVGPASACIGEATVRPAEGLNASIPGRERSQAAPAPTHLSWGSGSSWPPQIAGSCCLYLRPMMGHLLVADVRRRDV